MSKRKNKSNNQQKQVHPQKSFQELVADATRAALSGYIDAEIQGLGQALAQRQAQTNNNLKLRIICTEELIMEMNPAITKETLATRVSAIQDRLEGFDALTAEAAVEKGDRVYVELKTRTQDQTEYQGTSRLMIDNIGEGATLGSELESAILGMKSGEVKEIKFGKDESLAASIALNRASRSNKPKRVAKVAEPAPESEEDAEAAEGAVNADPNAKSEETADASPNAG